MGVRRLSLASTIGIDAGLAQSGALSENLAVPLTAPHVIPTFKRISELLGKSLSGPTGLEIVHLRIGGAWGPPTDVVEVHVNAVGCRLTQVAAHVGVLAVDDRIEAQIFDQPPTLLGAAGDPDRAGTQETTNLAGNAADRAGSPGHEYRLPGSGAANVEHAEVSGQAGGAQRAERDIRIDRLDAAAVGDGV